VPVAWLAMADDTLTVDRSYTVRVCVTPELSPPHLAPVVVLATPHMISLMEQASTTAVQPLLEAAGKTTVGTHIDVSHEAAARGGDEVEVSARLAAVDGPRLTFQVEARVGERIIGRGTHRRHIVDRARFGT
jgi:fluoroacetyl-CoA thioesterase